MSSISTKGSTFNKKLDSELFNPNCKSNTMNKEELARLIDYYRMRVINFEKERLEWMSKLEGQKIKNEEFHKREWELRKLVDKITELQFSLSESNIALNQERKKVIHYSNEIETYKCKLN
ncbi:MAG: hypothetical protein MJ252_01950 [archaeon]|nr:hypothetical protein [archaeon]